MDDRDKTIFELRRAAVVRSGWRGRRAAKRLARMPDPLAAWALAGVVTETTDDRLVAIAEPVLSALSDQDAIDWVCDLAITTGDERLTALVSGGRYLPSSPERRALLLFLQHRFDLYAELDSDGSLLRAAHRDADADLCLRLADSARAGGRIEWVRAVADRQDRRLAEMSDTEWETGLHLLAGAREWEELWRLALEAPAIWAARMLRELGQQDWSPAGPTERARYRQLLAIAQRCDGPLTPDCLYDDAKLLATGYDDVVIVAVNPAGDLLAAVGGGGPVQLWRLPSGEPIDLGGDAPVPPSWPHCLTFSPDGRVLTVGCGGGIFYWSVPPEREPRWARSGYWHPTYPMYSRSDVTQLAYTPDSQSLVCGFSDGAVGVWLVDPIHAKPLELKAAFTWLCRRARRRARRRERQALAVTPDSQWVITARSGEEAKIWFLPWCHQLGVLQRSESGIGPLAVISGGSMVAAADDDGMIRLWKLPSGTPAGILGQASDRVRTLAMAPDDGLAVSAGNLTGLITVWRRPFGMAAGMLWYFVQGAHSLAVGADGAVVASSLTGPPTMSANVNRYEVALWRRVLPSLDTAVPRDITPAQLAQLRARRRQDIPPRDQALLDLIVGLARAPGTPSPGRRGSRSTKGTSSN